MKKKLFSLLLSFLLFFGLCMPVLAAGLSDLPETKWYYAAVHEMVEQGYIQGYPDGTFRGENAMSMAEFVTLLADLKGISCGEQEGHWAGKQLAQVKALGWMCDSDISFCGGVDGAIPRQVAAKLLTNALDIVLRGETALEMPFGDLNSIHADYLGYVAEAYRENLIQGDADGNFYPNGVITRGAAATLIYRAVHRNDPISRYSKQEIIDYFAEVALYSEYDGAGNPGGSHPAVKWTKPIYYYVGGGCTYADIDQVEAMAERMNRIKGFPGLYPAQSRSSADLTIDFLSGGEMDRYPGWYIENLEGYFTFNWNGAFQIYKSGIAVRADMDQYTRNSVICEEMIQSMGLANDSYLYEDSIFFQLDSDLQWPADLDWKLMELLYDPAVKPGMSEAECRSILARLIP